MWRAGQKIGGYELLAKLRDGGMATLFLARREGAVGFARHVAIKVVHADLANDEQFRQMFLDEARLASRIRHPNVVHVEELGRHGAAHFLVMEFVHGCSLAQLQRTLRARGRRLSPAFAVRIAMQVAEALHAAHEARDASGRLLDVVHRDVTPENVLLAYTGHVKLIDFGIAKSFGRKHRTHDGLLKGKFRYMAPEQALGRPVDRRVDVYQLGIILWEMLTLRRLFDAERDVDLLASVQRPHIAPPSALVAGIPPALDLAVMHALEADPGNRPADARTLARMLGHALPAAREVEAEALRQLLQSTMDEQRQRERQTYPPGVLGGLQGRPEGAPRRDEGSCAHDGPPAAGTCLDAADAPTRPGPGAARLRARSAPPAGAQEPEVRRSSPVVQLRRELKRALLRARAKRWGSRAGYWLGLLGVLGATGGLAVLTREARPRAWDVPPLPSLRAAAALRVDAGVGARHEETRVDE